MGRKKHSLGKEFSEQSLKKLCADVTEDDGGRFAGDESNYTHKGLGEKKKYKEKHGNSWKNELEV